MTGSPPLFTGPDGMPAFAKDVIRSLLAKGPRTPKQISTDLALSIRTVNGALRRLQNDGRVKKSFDLLDMRNRVYSLTEVVR